MLVEFLNRTQQTAMFGNTGGLQRCRVELVAQHAHHPVMHLLQGFAQQRGTGFAQLRMGARSRHGGQLLPVPGHAQFLQRPQCIDRLPDKRNANALGAQALELCRHAKGLGGIDGCRGEDNFHLGICALGERSDRCFRIGEFEKQAAEAEIADFAGDFGVARLRDDGCLRDLEAPVTP